MQKIHVYRESFDFFFLLKSKTYFNLKVYLLVLVHGILLNVKSLNLECMQETASAHLARTKQSRCGLAVGADTYSGAL